MDKTTVMLESENSSGVGLYVPGKDKVVYIPQERKSRLGIFLLLIFLNILYMYGHTICMVLLIDNVTGLDVLANAKRESSQHDMGFKVPKERIASMAASATEEESGISTVDEEKSINMKKHTNRRYREATSETPQPGI